MRVTFNREARERYVCFSVSPEAKWNGNFRDLNASITRMATLSAGGRIDVGIVEAEISVLQQLWQTPDDHGDDEALLRQCLDERTAATIDPFDRVQLAYVIRTCVESRSLSDAGRQLFAISRLQKSIANDADRLRKYLARFGLRYPLALP